MVWIQFVICLAIIVVAGTKLAKYGDLIAEKTGLGRVWIGVVLLATITSLPELATGISSVTLVGEPDLTMGDLFGSNLINLLIIAIIDLVHRDGRPVLHYLGTGIVLSTVLSLFLIAAAATSLYLAQNVLTILLFGRFGIYSLMLFLLYLLAQYMIYRFQPEKSEDSQRNEAAPVSNLISLKRVVTLFVVAAVVTAGAGTWLAFIGNQIAEVTGFSTSFVGTLFLAVCTSAPEIVVSISAVRLGTPHMAVGNVVGSNLFNMGVIIFMDDLFYAGGSILQGVSIDHIVTALFAVLMSSIVIIGIIFKPRLWLRIWVGADTVALTVIYIAAMVTIYLLSKLT